MFSRAAKCIKVKKRNWEECPYLRKWNMTWLSYRRKYVFLWLQFGVAWRSKNMGEKIRNSIADVSAHLAQFQVVLLPTPGNSLIAEAGQVMSFDATVNAGTNP